MSITRIFDKFATNVINTLPFNLNLSKNLIGISWEPAGLKTNLLRQWDNGSYFLNFSLHSLAMRLKIKKTCTRSPTWLVTIA